MAASSNTLSLTGHKAADKITSLASDLQVQAIGIRHLFELIHEALGSDESDNDELNRAASLCVFGAHAAERVADLSEQVEINAFEWKAPTIAAA